MLVTFFLLLLMNYADATSERQSCSHYLHSRTAYDAIIGDLAYLLRHDGRGAEEPDLRRAARESVLVAERMDMVWAFWNHAGRYIHFDHFILAAFRAAELNLHFKVHFPFPFSQRVDHEPGWPTGPDFIGMSDGRIRPAILHLKIGLDPTSRAHPLNLWTHAREAPVVVLLRPRDGSKSYQSLIMLDGDGHTMHRPDGRRGQLERREDDDRVVAWFKPWLEYRQYDHRLTFAARAHTFINGIKPPKN